jgi:hypothetical protein
MCHVYNVILGKWYQFKSGFPKGSKRAYYKFHDGTAAFHRRVWDSGIRYSNEYTAQKLDFLNGAVSEGFRHRVIPNRGNFVYIRHSVNIWTFPDDWMVEVKSPPYFSSFDLEYYSGFVNGTSDLSRV